MVSLHRCPSKRHAFGLLPFCCQSVLPLSGCRAPHSAQVFEALRPHHQAFLAGSELRSKTMVRAPLQPFVLCHGRVQCLQMLINLRHFGKHPAAAHPASFSTSACSAAPHSHLHAQRGYKYTPWRAAASQQLVGYETAAQGAAATPAVQPSPASISPGEIHVWWLDLTKGVSESYLERCKAMLTEEELQDCCASQDAAVRRERVVARALVRSVLAGYLPSAPPPRSLLFEKNAHGKPRLLWPAATPSGQQLRFNLTHTSTLIGLAVSVDGMVGLDVECASRRTRRDPLRLARRRFSSREVDALEACSDEASRAARFLQLWTLKEAYVKAVGRGISAAPGLRSFGFRLDCWDREHADPDSQGTPAGVSTIRLETAHRDGHKWDFALLQPAPGHVAAVCAEPGISGGGSSSSAGGAAARQRLQVLHFAVDPFDGSMRALQPQLLALGRFP